MLVIFWIVVAIAATVLELMTPTALISIWFASGAVIALLLELLHVELVIQITAFFIVSLVTLFIVRPVAAKYLRGNTVATNADRMINEIGIVIKDIEPNEWGEVKIKGTLWSAVDIDGKEIKKDSRVKVIAIEGAKLIVRSVDY